MRIGVPELLILTVILGVPIVGVVTLLRVRRSAKRLGYGSTRAYLRAAPRSDAERRDAADLALKGLVACMFGFFFAPFVLFGLIPLFYGARKLIYASMGLGLIDDGDEPAALALPTVTSSTASGAATAMRLVSWCRPIRAYSLAWC